MDPTFEVLLSSKTYKTNGHSQDTTRELSTSRKQLSYTGVGRKKKREKVGHGEGSTPP